VAATKKAYQGLTVTSRNCRYRQSIDEHGVNEKVNAVVN